jgi:hypothetical protein
VLLKFSFFLPSLSLFQEKLTEARRQGGGGGEGGGSGGGVGIGDYSAVSELRSRLAVETSLKERAEQREQVKDLMVMREKGVMMMVMVNCTFITLKCEMMRGGGRDVREEKARFARVFFLMMTIISRVPS